MEGYPRGQKPLILTVPQPAKQEKQGNSGRAPHASSHYEARCQLAHSAGVQGRRETGLRVLVVAGGNGESTAFLRLLTQRGRLAWDAPALCRGGSRAFLLRKA